MFTYHFIKEMSTFAIALKIQLFHRNILLDVMANVYFHSKMVNKK